MTFHDFWCISFVFSQFLKHVQKTRKSWEKVCSSESRKYSYRLEKASKLPFFFPTSFSENHAQKSWDTFAFVGRFPIHTGPNPPLTLQTMLEACIQNFFSEFQLCIVWGKEEVQENFQNNALFKEGIEKWQKSMHIAILTQGLLSRVVVVLQ